MITSNPYDISQGKSGSQSVTFIGSLAVSLLLAEGVVRVFAPQEIEKRISWYEAHPVYRFRHKPNLNHQKRFIKFFYLRTNSHGLRGSREIAYEPGDKWRVFVYGDYFTFGNGLNEENLFVTLAENYLKEQGIDVAEVVNMGVSAYSPSLEYLYFLEEGRRYSTDVVVIAIFLGNDVIGVVMLLSARYRTNMWTHVDIKMIPRLKRIVGIGR